MCVFCVSNKVKFHKPILCSCISGFQTMSSSFRWRSISSSYSTIVCLKTLNISSAAAVSRSLTNSLKHSTEDIVVYMKFNNYLRFNYSIDFRLISLHKYSIAVSHLCLVLFTSAGCHAVKVRLWKFGSFSFRFQLMTFYSKRVFKFSSKNVHLLHFTRTFTLLCYTVDSTCHKRRNRAEVLLSKYIGSNVTNITNNYERAMSHSAEKIPAPLHRRSSR